MEFSIIEGDVLKMTADALVFPANHKPIIGGSLDNQIFEKAGKEALLNERCNYGYLYSGEACITDSYAMKDNYKWFIHTATPVYQPKHQQNTLHKLKKCYLSALKLAEEKGIRTLVFALLGAGASGFSRDKAIQAAKSAINRYFSECHESSIESITIVEYEKESQYQLLLRCNDKLKEINKLLSEIENFEKNIQYASYIGEIRISVEKHLRQYAEAEIKQIKCSYEREIKRLSSCDSCDSNISPEDKLYKKIVDLPDDVTQSDFAATIYVSRNTDISQLVNLYSKNGKFYKNAISFLNVKKNVLKLGLGLELPFDKMCWLMWCRGHEFPISEWDFELSEYYIKKGKSLSALEDYEEEFENTKRKEKEIEL